MKRFDHFFTKWPGCVPWSSLSHANASTGPCASGSRPPWAWHFDGQLCSSGPTPAVRITHATNLPWCPAAKPGPAAPLLFINMHEHANEPKKRTGELAQRIRHNRGA